jgi:hypothetical protein
MPNKNYINGRSLEYRIKNILKENGFAVVRSAGSHGKWDLIAVNESRKTIYLISCKKGKRKRQIKKGSYQVSEFLIGSTKDLTNSLSTLRERARVRGAVKNKNSITNDKPNPHIFFSLHPRLCKYRAGNGI